jgi:hypothetical protein
MNNLTCAKNVVEKVVDSKPFDRSSMAGSAAHSDPQALWKVTVENR